MWTEKVGRSHQSDRGHVQGNSATKHIRQELEAKSTGVNIFQVFSAGTGDIHENNNSKTVLAGVVKKHASILYEICLCSLHNGHHKIKSSPAAVGLRPDRSCYP